MQIEKLIEEQSETSHVAIEGQVKIEKDKLFYISN